LVEAISIRSQEFICLTYKNPLHIFYSFSVGEKKGMLTQNIFMAGSEIFFVNVQHTIYCGIIEKISQRVTYI